MRQFLGQLTPLTVLGSVVLVETRDSHYVPDDLIRAFVRFLDKSQLLILFNQCMYGYVLYGPAITWIDVMIVIRFRRVIEDRVKQSSVY